MRGYFTTPVRVAALSACALIGAGLAMQAPPARAQTSGSCPVVAAGAAVRDLSGENLGQLGESVTPLDCDDSYSLVPWGDGVGIVARPGASGSRSVTAPSCVGGADDGVLCKAKNRIVSKLDEWRGRYGIGHPRKK